MDSNIVGPAWSWRLVYSETQVMAFFESSGYTEAIWHIFEAQTKAECDAKIIELGLIPIYEEPPEYPPPEEDLWA